MIFRIGLGKFQPPLLAADAAQQFGECPVQPGVRTAVHVESVADDVGERMRERLPQILQALVELQHVDRAALFHQEIEHDVDRLAAPHLRNRLDAQADDRLVGRRMRPPK